MVEPKSKKVIYFMAFILPCLVLYLLFFIWPFFKGIGISLTNWDGLTPRSPISMSQEQFESEILSKLSSKQQKYLLSVYELNVAEKNYSRLSIGGFTRSRVESLFKKAGYEADKYKFVGFENYAKILTGKVDKKFYPHSYQETKFTASANSSLKSIISKKEFEKEVLDKATEEEKQLLLLHYEEQVKTETTEARYVLKKEFDEFSIESILWDLPEVVSTKNISESEIEKYANEVKKSAIEEDNSKCSAVMNAFIGNHELSESSLEAVKDSTSRLYDLGHVKNVLAKVWVLDEFNMGVVGFTLFFALFSVIGINLLAFALALALDTGINGQKIFRTLFFLPNVLSMVIVALIWSMLFVQLLPAITGIEKWISDSHKTPWLLVLTAVWQGCGYYMIVYLAGLQNIPTDCIEASTIDGATSIQRFWFIKLPLLLPSITVSLFLTIANALKSFDLIYAMIGPTGYATGTVPFVMDIYYDAYAQKAAGLATAKAMLLFLVIFAITGLQLFLMKRKEVEQ